MPIIKDFEFSFYLRNFKFDMPIENALQSIVSLSLLGSGLGRNALTCLHIMSSCIVTPKDIVMSDTLLVIYVPTSKTKIHKSRFSDKRNPTLPCATATLLDKKWSQVAKK